MMLESGFRVCCSRIFLSDRTRFFEGNRIWARFSSNHTRPSLTSPSTFGISTSTSKREIQHQTCLILSRSIRKKRFSSGEKMVGESGILRFKKLSDKAFVPTRGSEKAAGFDLKSAYNVKVPARGKALCMTDIQIALPSGCYGRIAPRSGLALKHGLDVGAGVIDEDYRGNVGVILFNHSDTDFEVKEGDRIAQLICERIMYPDLVEVHDLDKTERDAGGFGSTGTN